MIPGIPNGVLPHLFARTKVSFGRFLVAVAAGNAPSTLVCTLVGDRLAHGDWRSAIVIIVIFVACIIAALRLRRKLITLISGGYSLSLGSASWKHPENEAEGASERNSENVTGMVDIKTTDGEKISDKPNNAEGVENEELNSEKNETRKEDSDNELQALGTVDIAPHGWRIIKGKKR
jgi:hypothetical protein